MLEDVEELQNIFMKKKTCFDYNVTRQNSLKCPKKVINSMATGLVKTELTSIDDFGLRFSQ